MLFCSVFVYCFSIARGVPLVQTASLLPASAYTASPYLRAHHSYGGPLPPRSASPPAQAPRTNLFTLDHRPLFASPLDDVGAPRADPTVWTDMNLHPPLPTSTDNAVLPSPSPSEVPPPAASVNLVNGIGTASGPALTMPEPEDPLVSPHFI